MEEKVQEPDWTDGGFYRKTKAGYKPVEAPSISRFPLCDVHTHLQCLADPGLALARAGYRMVGFICTVVDVAEDGDTTLRKLDDWKRRASSILFGMPGGCPS